MRRCASLKEATSFTTSPLLMNAADRAAFGRVEDAVRLTRYGGDCYSYCMLAAGHLDLVVETELKPYDIAALIPIITGAGGIVTTWEGKPAQSGGRIVAAGDPRVHEAALKLLNSQDARPTQGTRMDAMLIVDMQVGLLSGDPKHDLHGVIDRINRLAAKVHAHGRARSSSCSIAAARATTSNRKRQAGRCFRAASRPCRYRRSENPERSLCRDGPRGPSEADCAGSGPRDGMGDRSLR